MFGRLRSPNIFTSTELSHRETQGRQDKVYFSSVQCTIDVADTGIALMLKKNKSVRVLLR